MSESEKNAALKVNLGRDQFRTHHDGDSEGVKWKHSIKKRIEAGKNNGTVNRDLIWGRWNE